MSLTHKVRKISNVPQRAANPATGNDMPKVALIAVWYCIGLEVSVWSSLGNPTATLPLLYAPLSHQFKSLREITPASQHTLNGKSRLDTQSERLSSFDISMVWYLVSR